MIAIVLNSGIGTRLGKYTKNNPKCMVEIKEGVSIIKYQLTQLMKVGIKDVIITTGYMSELLREHLKDLEINITYVHNPEYEITNYIKSLDNIESIQEDVILLHGDLVFEEVVLEDVVNSKNSCVVIDSTMELPLKDFKAVIRNGRVTAIGVEFFENAYAAQPLYKLINSDWIKWKNTIREFCDRDEVKVYAEKALNTITDQIQIIPLNIKGRLCSEIDNEQDLLNIRARL